MPKKTRLVLDSEIIVDSSYRVVLIEMKSPAVAEYAEPEVDRQIRLVTVSRIKCSSSCADTPTMGLYDSNNLLVGFFHGWTYASADYEDGLLLEVWNGADLAEIEHYYAEKGVEIAVPTIKI